MEAAFSGVKAFDEYVTLAVPPEAEPEGLIKLLAALANVPCACPVKSSTTPATFAPNCLTIAQACDPAPLKSPL